MLIIVTSLILVETNVRQMVFEFLYKLGYLDFRFIDFITEEVYYTLTVVVFLLHNKMLVNIIEMFSYL